MRPTRPALTARPGSCAPRALLAACRAAAALPRFADVAHVNVTVCVAVLAVAVAAVVHVLGPPIPAGSAAAPARPPSPPPGTANPRLPAPLCRASVATHEARGHLARRRLVAHHVPRLVGVDLVPRLTVIPAAVAVARRSPAARVAPGIGAPRCRVRVFVVGAAAAAARALATPRLGVVGASSARSAAKSPA